MGCRDAKIYCVSKKDAGRQAGGYIWVDIFGQIWRKPSGAYAAPDGFL